MSGVYQSISAPGQGLYKEKGSKFESYAFHVQSESEVQGHLARIRKLHHKARHYCFAYVLKEEDQSRAYDDGEPRHSAGDPILGQIRSHHLRRTMVVVVRYFGGTKLGKSGLVRAYREAAKRAIETSQITGFEPSEKILVTFPFAKTDKVLRLVKDLQLTVVEQNLGITSELMVEVPLSLIGLLEKGIRSMPEVKTGESPR